MSDRSLADAQIAAGRFFRDQLLGAKTDWAATHLIQRGLGHVLRASSPWKVGYAPEGWSRLVDHLRRAGFEDETLVTAGLASVTRDGYLVDRFRDRIMFPAWDSGQHLAGFVGRGRGGRAKYLNSPTTPIYRKSETLVGLAEQRDLLDSGAIPVVVEGPMDAASVDELSRLTSSRWAGLAVCGTALSFQQASILAHFADSEIVIVGLDADGGGRPAAVRWLDDLSMFFDRVLVAEFPSGHDPSSLLVTPAGADRLYDALSAPRPLAELAIEVELARWSRVLDHISGRVDALRRVAPLVARLPHDRVAGQLAKLSEDLELEPEIVSREVVETLGRSTRRVLRGSSSDPPSGQHLPHRGP